MGFNRKNALLITIRFLVNILETSCYYKETVDGIEFILPLEQGQDSSTLPVKKTFLEAVSWCEVYGKGFRFAEIGDKSFQESVSKFLNNAVRENKIAPDAEARVRGKFYNLGKHVWVNDGRDGIECSSKSRHDRLIDHNYGEFLTKYYRCEEEHAKTKHFYFCEYKGNSSGIDCSFTKAGRCFVFKTEQERSWYDARNDCLDGGGELASFDFEFDSGFNESLKRLTSKQSVKEYWIGTSSVLWRWHANDKDGCEIKYTNWKDGAPEDEGENKCLCLKRSNVSDSSSDWQWVTCICNKALGPLVCVKHEAVTCESKPDSSSTSQGAIIGSVLGVIIVLAIAAVLIIIIIIQRRKRHSEKTSSTMSSLEGPSVLDAAVARRRSASDCAKKKLDHQDSANFYESIQDYSDGEQGPRYDKILGAV